MRVSKNENTTTVQTGKGYLAFYFCKSKGEVEALARSFKFGIKKFVKATCEEVSPCHFFCSGSSLTKGDEVVCQFECK